MKAGHGSGNLECPAAHYYASQVVNLPHKVSQSNSQNSKSEPRYEIRGKIKQTTSRPPPLLRVTLSVPQMTVRW